MVSLRECDEAAFGWLGDLGRLLMVEKEGETRMFDTSAVCPFGPLATPKGAPIDDAILQMQIWGQVLR